MRVVFHVHVNFVFVLQLDGFELPDFILRITFVVDLLHCNHCRILSHLQLLFFQFLFRLSLFLDLVNLIIFELFIPKTLVDAFMVHFADF